MNLKEGEKILAAHVAQLSEHFDCVQIMVSTHMPGDQTMCCKRGCGNWYARQGMAREFITDEESASQAAEIAPLINPPDEGDKWKAD